MKADGMKTFWGADFGEDLDERTRKLFGGNLELHTTGSDARNTEERQVAVEILDDPQVEGLNDRQILLKFKAAHGSGNNLTFPDADQIKANMQGYPEDFKVDIYGDGSYTSPTVWWAAFGGFGIWMPKWPSPSQVAQEDIMGPSQQPKPQPPHLPQLDQSSSSSWDPTGERG